MQHSGDRRTASSAGQVPLQLGQHTKDVRLVVEASASYSCDVCGGVFGSKRCIAKHIRNVHRTPQHSAFLCSRCGARVSPDKLDEHESSHTPGEAEGPGCQSCGAKFANKSNLQRHLSRVHELVVSDVSCRENLDVGCPLCEDKLKRSLLDRHVKDAHGVEIDTDVLIFYSKEDFFQWKSAMEAETLSSFVTRSSSAGKALFVCHRAGHSTGRWGGDKKTRRWASAKTGRWCPARITARYVGGGGGTVWARFCKTHLGHGRSARFLRLSKAERAALAQRIRRGETLDAILGDVRASAPPHSRLGALSKRDLHNIVRDFGLHSLKREASPTPTHPHRPGGVDDHSYCVSDACV